jgi:hypothetical protein
MPVEPLANLAYRRGQISWRQVDGQIIGAGRVYVPAGVELHRIVYAHTPAIRAATRHCRNRCTSPPRRSWILIRSPTETR